MSTLTTTPYYRLRELIYRKYGVARFALGCEITARWVAFETRKPCTMEDVQFWSNMLTEDAAFVGMATVIDQPQARAIMTLFGIKNEYELFTPEPQNHEHNTTL